MKAGEIEIIEWQKAGLLKLSVLKPIFTTVKKKLILRKLGEFEKKDRLNLQNNLQNLIG